MATSREKPSLGELVYTRNGEASIRESVYPTRPPIKVIAVENGTTDNIAGAIFLAEGQRNTTKIYHEIFSEGITENQVHKDLHAKDYIATTFLAIMKPSESGRLGLAGNMQLSTAKERMAAGIHPPLEFMEHLIPAGGMENFYRELGVTADEAGELQRFTITPRPKHDGISTAPTFRDFKVDILRALLDKAMKAAKEKGLKKVVLVTQPDLDQLFEDAGRMPTRFEGAKLIQADPYNSKSKEINRFYKRYPNYWLRQDGSVPQISVYDVDEYDKMVASDGKRQ